MQYQNNQNVPYQPPVPENAGVIPSPQQSVPPAHEPIQPQPEINPNAVTFTSDSKVMELIGMIHPEMASAAISLAIKKFAETDEFWKYFVLDEYQSFAQKEQLLENSKSQKEVQTETPTAAPAMDFTSW